MLTSESRNVNELEAGHAVCVILLTCCHGHGGKLISEGRRGRERHFAGRFCSLGNPAFAFSEVELVSSRIEAIDFFAERADVVEGGVQVAGNNSLFSLATREFSLRGATSRFPCLVSHVVVVDRG